MNLEELDQMKRDEPPSTSITIRHMAVVQETDGIIKRIPLEIITGDPDFHIGAVGGE